MPRSLIVNWIKQYKKFVNFTVHGKKIDYTNVFSYWQNKTFASLVMYVMPACILALIPSIALEIREGNYLIAIIDLFTFFGAYFTALNSRLSLHCRKVIVVVVLSLFALSQLILGSFNMGIIYFFALSIFITLQFSAKKAISAFGVKTSIFVFFTIAFYFDRNLLTNHLHLTLSRWIIHSSNFLFIDLIIVIILTQLLGGLEKTMFKKTVLYSQLEKEMALKAKQNQLLIQSRRQYLTLFSKNPVAVCVVDSLSRKFIQVNQAALAIYGYTESEFLNLKIDDLKLKGQTENLHQFSDEPFGSINVTKSGEAINVEIRCTEIVYDGMKANLIIIADTTDRERHLGDIERQNEKLRDIAFMQSHTVRVPVANIKGLTNLILDTVKSEEEKEMLTHLKSSVEELDTIISNIVRQAN